MTGIHTGPKGIVSPGEPLPRGREKRRAIDAHDRRRLERHVRRLGELRNWRNADERRVREWRFVAGDGEPVELGLGDFWPAAELPVYLSAEAVVPREWAGRPVELELWLGGEGFVRLSTGTSGGLNPFHRSFPVAEEARGGEPLEIEAEVVSKGLFGSNVAEPRLERASLVVPEGGVRALERDLGLIAEACEELGDHDAVPLLLDALDAAFSGLAADWPSGTGVAVTRYLRAYAERVDGLSSLPASIAAKVPNASPGLRELWSMPESPGPMEPLPEGARRAVGRARKKLAARLAEIKGEHPPVGRLALSGHAHLDLAWLWPLSETRRKGRRTFASVLGLMQRYEDFVFNQSSAQLYAWIEEDDPELFGRVRERVREGRWEPVGGMWCESDCQIPGGESFVRQLLYGQGYFRERFGRRSTVAWLPDVFGFSPGIPQLLRGAGMTGLFTAKLRWNEMDRFPHDLFAWEGIDGSRVVAHTTENPGMDYNGDVVPYDLLGVWRNFRGKRRHPEGLFPFGWGDGGGGPTERMLESYARLKDFPALPRLRMARVEDFFAALPREGLPIWVGELYLELHRGTLTTQGALKKLNREAEHRLLEAEAFATMAATRGAAYPAEEFDRLWKTLLLNQFHDILPGSSISEVREDARRQLGGVVQDAEKLRDHALRGFVGAVPDGAVSDGGAVVVANASLRPRPLSLLLWGDLGPEEPVEVTDAAGSILPAQETRGGGLLVHAPDRTVPALGCTTLLLRRRSPDPAVPEDNASGTRSGRLGDGGAFLENEFLRVEIGADGALHRVYDKEVGREVLTERGNQLWAYVDKPREWDAWDVDEDYELEGEEISGVEGLRDVEDGPLRATVDLRRSWRGSKIEQTYVLHAGSRRLDVDTTIDWHERQILLRALFPINVRAGEATFETMYGVVRRPTHRNTSWDATRFEVAAHRFCDLCEPGYDVALLNDGKYGHSARDNALGISLLRSPLYPNPFADEGYHRFTYSLFPHPGGWAEAGVTAEALALNSPLVAAAVGGAPPVERGLVDASGTEVALGSLKMARDGRALILRLYEPHGARGPVSLRFDRGVKRAERTNLLEEPEGTMPEVEKNVVHLEVRPLEVVTLRVALASGALH